MKKISIIVSAVLFTTSAFASSESEFISTIVNARSKIKEAPNDMIKGQLKSKRDLDVCTKFSATPIKDWSGEISYLGFKKGNGSLQIKLYDGVSLETLDVNYDGNASYITPDSDIFKTLSSLTVGDRVRFSGNFITGFNHNCITNDSWSDDGDVSYSFKFTSLASQSKNTQTYNTTNNKPQKNESNELVTYGMETSSNESFGDQQYPNEYMSKELKTCIKKSFTTEQLNSCLSDESVRMSKSIEDSLDKLKNAKKLKNGNDKQLIIDTITTNMNRISYLCDVFFIDNEGQKKPKNEMAYTSANTCAVWRLHLLSYGLSSQIDQIIEE
jgi:hypothetical protein